MQACTVRTYWLDMRCSVTGCTSHLLRVRLKPGGRECGQLCFMHASSPHNKRTSTAVTVFYCMCLCSDTWHSHWRRQSGLCSTGKSSGWWVCDIPKCVCFAVLYGCSMFVRVSDPCLGQVDPCLGQVNSIFRHGTSTTDPMSADPVSAHKCAITAARARPALRSFLLFLPSTHATVCA